MTATKPEQSSPGSFVGATSTAASPAISVVIPTFNRRDSICRLVDSLGNQTLPPDQFEVIVVSDGSTDGTVTSLRQKEAGSVRLTVLEIPNGGPAAARNAGAAAARGRYLAFTDDDCVPSPSWLEQLLICFQHTGAVAVQGCTTTVRADRTPLTHQIEILSPWLSAMQTCNAAYAKAVFDQVGGFDQVFRTAHNEDRDLIWRVEELGPVVFASEAKVLHPPRKETFRKIPRRVRVFESDFLLNQKNPAKYQRYVSSSPWKTIGYHVAVVQQLNELKSNFRYLVKSFHPIHFVTGILIVLARWYYLVRFLPVYFKAAKSSRAGMLTTEQLTSAKQVASRYSA